MHKSDCSSVANRIYLKVWQGARRENANFIRAKKNVQNIFRKKLGFNVDKPEEIQKVMISPMMTIWHVELSRIQSYSLNV